MIYLKKTVELIRRLNVAELKLHFTAETGRSEQTQMFYRELRN